MSGHSHWSKIKYHKKAADAKKGKAFSKMGREIAVTAKEGGSNPDFNSKLRIVIEKAKSLNMPTDNIERAIKKGAGEIEGIKLEELIIEAFGPRGVAIIIEGITDNKNRTLGEVKQILVQHNGKLADPGSVKWLFERKGCVTVDRKLQNEDLQNKENLELKAIDAGAEDIYWHNDVLDVFTKIEDLEKVKRNLENQGIKIDLTSLDWVAKENIPLEEKDKQACQKLFEALDENDAVQEIYSNIKLP